MQNIAEELFNIEEQYIAGDFTQAYEKLYFLCRDNQVCNEFSSAAMSIFARHNELDNNIMAGLVSSSQQENKQREVRQSFQMLLVRLKKRFSVQQSTKMDTLHYSSQSQNRNAQRLNGIKLFYSYAHKDENLRESLETHLTLLRRQGIIDDWHDRKIMPGQEWDNEIDENMETAHIILLLISADFLASDYCYGKELAYAMQRHDEKSAVVIPIALRPCDTSGTDFMKLQGLPKNFKPVTQWSDQDEAFTDIAKGIREVAKKLKAQS